MSSSQQGQGQGGFSLFPNPNTSKPPPPVIRLQTPRPRRSESNERRAATPQDRRAATPEGDYHAYSTPPQSSPPQNGRQTPQQRTRTPIEFELSRREETGPSDGRQSAQSRGRDFGMNIHIDTNVNGTGNVPVQQPRPAAEVPGRTETAFSEANTLVRSNSGRSRRSIAKLPINDAPSSSASYPFHQAQPYQQPALRSIFPTYNPEVSLDQQEYAPTQMSPGRIPRAVISRQSYYEDATSTHSAIRSPRSPPAAAPGSRWPRRAATLDPPVIPKTCTTEQLKSLWKVTNGWKASASEGRVYCLKMSQQKDAPVYTLSSATQPFYNVRLDPTSVSANVTVSRHDPSKPYKAAKVEGNASSSSSILSGVGGSNGASSGAKATDKNWQEALSTKLEEPSRRLPPNDGLVALLMPSPATKMALEKANDSVAVATAEKECARLVWDEDTGSHYLVHGALATPFCVTIERCPAWSRVEYTLEHHESPQHIAKLTRDGTGGGWLELDTDIASKIDSFYILDVAITALLIVASADERNAPIATETFEPPPAALNMHPSNTRRLSSRLSSHRQDTEPKPASKKKQKRRKMEEFEIDVESQDGSSLDKGAGRKQKKMEDDLPFLLRVVVKVVKGLFKCLLWVLMLGFKCVAGVFKGLYSCVGSKY